MNKKNSIEKNIEKNEKVNDVKTDYVTQFERKVDDRPINMGDVVVGVNGDPYLVAFDDDGNKYAVNMINGHVSKFERVKIAEVINVKIVEV